MRTSKIVISSLSLTLIFVVLVTLWMPSIDDLFVETPYWNGLSGLYSVYEPVRLRDLGDWDKHLSPASNSTLFVIGPSSDFDEFDGIAVYDFLVDGGRVVLMDDFGTGNQLLELLELDVRFDGSLLEDPLFYEGDYGFPVILDIDFEDVDEIVMNLPTGLTHEGGVIASSSPFSYLKTGDQINSDDMGAIPVIVSESIGEGEMIVISDSSLFINSMRSYKDNEKLLEALVRGDMLIDESHLMPSRLTQAKATYRGVYELFSRVEIRYLFLALIGFGLFKLKWETEPNIKEEDEVQRVMEIHPSWDRELVNQIHDMRKEYE